jgi:hypothetical protein
MFKGIRPLLIVAPSTDLFIFALQSGFSLVTLLASPIDSSHLSGPQNTISDDADPID